MPPNVRFAQICSSNGTITFMTKEAPLFVWIVFEAIPRIRLKTFSFLLRCKTICSGFSFVGLDPSRGARYQQLLF